MSIRNQKNNLGSPKTLIPSVRPISKEPPKAEETPLLSQSRISFGSLASSEMLGEAEYNPVLVLEQQAVLPLQASNHRNKLNNNHRT
jgi:hypothetical protein